jgi:hypothetical protein
MKNTIKIDKEGINTHISLKTKSIDHLIKNETRRKNFETAMTGLEEIWLALTPISRDYKLLKELYKISKSLEEDGLLLNINDKYEFNIPKPKYVPYLLGAGYITLKYTMTYAACAGIINLFK